MLTAKELIARYPEDVSVNGQGDVIKESVNANPLVTRRIWQSLKSNPKLTNVPDELPLANLHVRLGKWVSISDQSELKEADLALKRPGGGLHVIKGQFRNYYDFKNTDLVFDQLEKCGTPLSGKLLDFGCSSFQAFICCNSRRNSWFCS